jgi:Bacterial CdiA-CT RNAse A domain
MQLDGLEGPRQEGPQLPVEDLAVYEAHGGHTLRRHVGLNAGDNVRRIAEGAAAAGCFLDQTTAQRAVETSIHRHRDDIAAWLWGPSRKLPYSFVEDLKSVVGNVLTRDDVATGVTDPTPVTAVRVVLRPSDELAAGFTLVTAYPTRSRRTIPKRAGTRRAPAGVQA